MQRFVLMMWTLLVAGCLSSRPEPLRTATNVWPGFEPLYAARDLGLLDPRRVHLIEASSSTEVSRMFRNGAIDAGGLTLDEAMRLADSGVDLAIVLVTDTSKGADAIVARPELTRLRDLEGRRLGLESTALGAMVAARAFELGHVDPAKVILVSLEIHEHARAFDDGRVDAVVTFEPVRSALLGRGAVSLFDSTQIPGEIVDVLVVRRRYLEQEPAIVDHLLSAWFEAASRLREQPEQILPIMAAREQMTVDAFRAALAGLDIPDEATNRELLTDPSGLRASGARLGAVMVERGLLSRPADVDGMLEAGPLLRVRR